MDHLYAKLEAIKSNAKKSSNRPYSLDTVRNKRTEVNKIIEEASEILADDSITNENRTKHTEKLGKLVEETQLLLDSHEQSFKLTKTIKITMSAKLDMNELATIVKLIPIFNGKKDELQSFITNLGIRSQTVSNEKKNSIFDFVFKSRLDIRVQNKVRQGTIPNDITELIDSLKAAYKSQKSSNTILRELTQLKQKRDNVMGFANKIESLITELNEIQIAEDGEENRTTIMRTNMRLAFNTFVNGLKDPQLMSTIDASQVTSFAEAVKIAERSVTRISQSNILYQTTQNNRHQNRGNNNKCNKCGRIHGTDCPAQGKKCNACGKFNHFATKCLNRHNNNNLNNNNRNNNHDNTRNNNNNNYRSANNSNYNNNTGSNNYRRSRNQNVRHVQNQGNFLGPETIERQDSPEQNN